MTTDSLKHHKSYHKNKELLDCDEGKLNIYFCHIFSAASLPDVFLTLWLVITPLQLQSCKYHMFHLDHQFPHIILSSCSDY